MGSSSAKAMDFSGEKDDVAETFVGQLEALKTLSGWSDAETAIQATLRMKGKAKIWVDILQLEMPETSSSWNLLKSALISRFSTLKMDEAATVKADEIKPFSGEDKTYLMEDFIRAVDLFAIKSGWTEEEKAQAAKNALRGKASVWMENLLRESAKVGSNWQELKQKLQERFGNVVPLVERVKILASLNQKGKESSEDFFDRINSRLYNLENEVLNSAQTEGERNAMLRMHQLFAGYLFVQGLEPEVKEQLLKQELATQKAQMPSLEEVKTVVRSIDESVKQKRLEMASKKEDTEKTKKATKKEDNEKTKKEGNEKTKKEDNEKTKKEDNKKKKAASTRPRDPSTHDARRNVSQGPPSRSKKNDYQNRGNIRNNPQYTHHQRRPEGGNRNDPWLENEFPPSLMAMPMRENLDFAFPGAAGGYSGNPPNRGLLARGRGSRGRGNFANNVHVTVRADLGQDNIGRPFAAEYNYNNHGGETGWGVAPRNGPLDAYNQMPQPRQPPPPYDF